MAGSGPVRVDYHLHTCYSPDSDVQIEAVLQRAASSGLDRLCVTDHDTIDGALELARIADGRIEVVVGCEFTTDDGSHVIGLGLAEMIPERRVGPLMEGIRAQGAAVVLPHPFRRSSGIFRNEAKRPPSFVADVLAATDMVESFNGGDSTEHNERNRELVAAYALPAVAGSDAHKEADIGSVFVEYDGPDPVDGMSAGSVWFGDRDSRRESRVRRVVMEAWHGHSSRLPEPLRAAYRAARRGRSPVRSRAAAVLQYRLDPVVRPGSDG